MVLCLQHSGIGRSLIEHQWMVCIFAYSLREEDFRPLEDQPEGRGIGSTPRTTTSQGQNWGYPAVGEQMPIFLFAVVGGCSCNSR